MTSWTGKIDLQNWTAAERKRADQLFWPHQAAIIRAESTVQLLLAHRLEFGVEGAETLLADAVQALTVLGEVEITAYGWSSEVVLAHVFATAQTVEDEALTKATADVKEKTAQVPEIIRKKRDAGIRMLTAAAAEPDRNKAVAALLGFREGFGNFATTSKTLHAISEGKPLPGSNADKRSGSADDAEFIKALAALVKVLS